MMNLSIGYSIVLLLSTYLQLVNGKVFAHINIKCGTCLAMMDEINHVISSVDPKRKIQVGSYRIDSEGNQKLNEVSYARSETHLSEVMDGVCNKMDDYAELIDQFRDAVYYARNKDREGTKISIPYRMLAPVEASEKMKSMCHEVLDQEEEIIKKFRDNVPKIEEEVCITLSGHCKPDYVLERKKFLQRLKLKIEVEEGRIEETRKLKEKREKIEAEEAAKKKAEEKETESESKDEDQEKEEEIKEEGEEEIKEGENEEAIKEDEGKEMPPSIEIGKDIGDAEYIDLNADSESNEEESQAPKDEL